MGAESVERAASLPPACPLVPHEPFLQALATAVKQHAEANGIPKSQVATFAMVSDNVGDTGGVREIHGAPPKNEEIER